MTCWSEQYNIKSSSLIIELLYFLWKPGSMSSFWQHLSWVPRQSHSVPKALHSYKTLITWHYNMYMCTFVSWRLWLPWEEDHAFLSQLPLCFSSDWLGQESQEVFVKWIIQWWMMNELFKQNREPSLTLKSPWQWVIGWRTVMRISALLNWYDDNNIQ